MPKKCITHFDGKPCTGNYDSSNEKVSVFRFPKDPQERALWVNALPSQVNVRDESVLCEKHWPKDFQRKKCQGPLGYRPHDPPSVFGTTPSSCFVLTAPSRLRDVDNRTVSGESRRKQQKIESEKSDTIMSWDDLKKYSQTVNLVSDMSEDNVIKLYHIQSIPPIITFSIFINRDMKVRAFKGNTSVSLRDVITGFDWRLSKYSEIDKVIEKVSSFPIDIHNELTQLSETLTELCNDSDDIDEQVKEKILFLLEQVKMCCVGSKGRRYSGQLIQSAVELMLRSRNCYRSLLNFLSLPNIKTLKSYFGKLGSPESIEVCKEVISSVFAKLDGLERYCFITADEIHVKPSVQFQKDQIIGFAVDCEEQKVAKTVLAIMINPSMGVPAFVARLLPINSLKHEFLKKQIDIVMEIVFEVGGFVFLIMTDNHSVNQKMFKVYHQNNASAAIYSVVHPHDNPYFKELFTFYDMTHCLKNIRNNWVTEKTQTLQFIDAETQASHFAKFSDIIQIFNEENESCLKETKLSYAALYPNNFEKQKVKLACDLFNEKTVAALEKKGLISTSLFVKMVTRAWNMLNIKSPNKGYRTNDPDRKPYSDKGDNRLEYIEKVAVSFKLMDSSIKGVRKHGLTSETSNALHQTMTGLVSLIKCLIDVGFKYVLSGKIQSDRLEGEFGVYRQTSGGNFHISTYQVYNGLKLQRIKLFNQLELSDKLQSSGISECCKGVAHSEDDQEIIDSCFQISTTLTEIEKSALYYISGYVAFKEGCCLDSTPVITNANSEFLDRVSRGALGHPPGELFDLSQYLYAFFKTREKKCCPQVFLDAYKVIYEFSALDIQNIDSKLRRFNNCFIKAFAKDINDKLKHADPKCIKQGRISGRRTVPI